MFKKYTSLILISFLSLTFVGCTSNKPAPYIDKSELVFKKNSKRTQDLTNNNLLQNNQTDAYNNSSAVSSIYDNNEIEQTQLNPIDNSSYNANSKLVMSDITANTNDAINNKSYNEVEKLSDIELENQIDKQAKSSFPQYNSVPNSNNSSGDNKEYKLLSPLGLNNFQWPVEGIVVSRFGRQGNKINEGINISAPLGTPVVSTANGKVVYIGNNVEGYGNLVIIKHESDIMSAYAHLKEIVVTRNSAVKKGESIGSVGQVGNISEPQLHFSLRKGKKTIDPEMLLK